MAYYFGTITCPSSTGILTISSLPFTPTRARFTTGAKIGATNTESRMAVGWADGTNQYANGFVSNSNGTFGKEYTDRCLIAMSTPGGSPGLEVIATFDSFGTNQCKLNFTTTVNTFRFVAEFWD